MAFKKSSIIYKKNDKNAMSPFPPENPARGGKRLKKLMLA